MARLQPALRQNQFYLDIQLYWDQAYAGESQNQHVVIDPHLPQAFGMTAVNDWPVYDGPDPHSANVVARARGYHTQAGKVGRNQWFSCCTIVFMDSSWYPGSTLAVTGIFTGHCKGELAIVGGTGEFTLAQGVIYHELVRTTEGIGEMRGLHIRAFYTPMAPPYVSELDASEVDAAIVGRNPLGTGGYGSVYQAVIRNTEVAVKILNDGSRQGEREFKQEVDILGRIRHPNLVILKGVCNEKFALIYEFLPKGTLEDRLSKEEYKESFSWEERVRIATSICSTLMFLHKMVPNPIAHSDLKPSNILFDAENVCKLGDFGISRLLKYTTDTTTPNHVTKWPKGSVPYVDPEFMNTGKLTPQSDVFAVGIILLQLVTGQGAMGLRKQVLDELESKDGTIFRFFLKPRKKNIHQIVDAKLKLNDESRKDAEKMLELGLRCSDDARDQRPDLANEVWPQIMSMNRSDASRSHG